MMHLAYPNATIASGFLGCVRYLSLPDPPAQYDEAGFQAHPHRYYGEERYPQSPNVESLYLSARELVQWWDQRATKMKVYKRLDQERMATRGASLDLAFLLALIRRARFCLLEHLGNDLGDAWCTGVLARRNGRAELDWVDRDIFALKLQGFVTACEDRLFFVPLFNMDPPELRTLCQDHHVEVLNLPTFTQRLARALQQGHWPGQAVITIANHELAFLAEILFRSHPNENPFRLFKAFQVSDALSFGGRDQEIAALAHLVMQPASRFVALIGPSGGGKSSLAFAGLVPKLLDTTSWVSATCELQLDEEGLLKYAPTQLFSPWRDTEQYEDEPHRAVDQSTIAEGRQSLTTYVTTLLQRAPEKKLLFIIDQFEKLFTTTPSQQYPFLENLTVLVRGELPCCVLSSYGLTFCIRLWRPRR